MFGVDSAPSSGGLTDKPQTIGMDPASPRGGLADKPCHVIVSVAPPAASDVHVGPDLVSDLQAVLENQVSLVVDEVPHPVAIRRLQRRAQGIEILSVKD